MVFDVYQRNVALLVLVFKDGPSLRWVFVSLVVVLFIQLIASSLLVLTRYAPYDSLHNICRGRDSLSWEFLGGNFSPSTAILSLPPWRDVGS